MSMREAALGRLSLNLSLPRQSLSRLAHAVWHGRSVRVQLLTIFALIELIAALVAGGVTILKARTSTQVEIAASMELAVLLVSEAVHLMQQEVRAEQLWTGLPSGMQS